MAIHKDDVDFSHMSTHITAKLPEIDRIHREKVGRDAIITSAREGAHREGSQHYDGRAIDLRILDMTRYQARRVTIELQHTLGGDYDVVLEQNHIHVEYNPD